MNEGRITNRPFDYFVDWLTLGNGALRSGVALNAASPFDALEIARRSHMRPNTTRPRVSLNTVRHCIESRRAGGDMTYLRICRLYEAKCRRCEQPIAMAEDPGLSWHPINRAVVERDGRIVYTRHRCSPAPVAA